MLNRNRLISNKIVDGFRNHQIRKFLNVPMEALFPAGSSQEHSERRLLKYSPQEIYEVVANVKEYKSFVPWCKESRVIKSDNNGMVAELDVGFDMFSEKYKSVIKLEPFQHISIISSDTTVLEHLNSEWTFNSLKNDNKRCFVDFKVKFKFKSSVYDSVSELFMTQVVKQMVKAFEDKCAQKYGSR